MFSLKPESDSMLHLDAFRFFASTGIVVYHWKANLLAANGALQNTSNLNFLSLSVDLFFVISGIVMYQIYSSRLESWAQFRQFSRKRFARLYPLHILTFLLMFAAGCIASRLQLRANHSELFDSHGIVPQLLLLHSAPFVKHLTFNAPSWSISAEMICYCLLPLALWLLRRNRWSLAIVGCATLATLTVMHHGFGWTTWTFNNGYIRALPSFCFGLTLGSLSGYSKYIHGPKVWLMVLSALFLCAGWCGAPRGFLFLVIYLIAACAYAADVNRDVHTVIRLMAPLGVLTYSIYMIHMVYLTLVIAFLFKRINMSPMLNNIAIVSSFPILLVLSYFSYRFVEMPARGCLSKCGASIYRRNRSQINHSKEEERAISCIPG